MIIHMHNHAGWRMREVDAATVGEAIKLALRETAKFLDDEYAEKWRLDHDDPSVEYPKFRIIWDHDEPKTFILGCPRYRGDIWWSDRFQVGESDDCPSCGGTGTSHYYIWRQCWSCGDKDKEGRSTGKRAHDPAASRLCDFRRRPPQ